MVLVVGISPDCGKSSLCAYLARAHPEDVHLDTNHFFSFLAHRIAPSLPASKAHNETVVADQQRHVLYTERSSIEETAAMLRHRRDSGSLRIE